MEKVNNINSNTNYELLEPEQKTRKTYGYERSIVIRPKTDDRFKELVPPNVSKEKVLTRIMDLIDQYNLVDDVKNYKFYNKMWVKY